MYKVDERFEKSYQAWLNNALAQYNATHEARLYHQESAPKGCDRNECVVIAENGNAYVFEKEVRKLVQDAVTPWPESEFFVEG